ncbi:hypothetical protein LPJ63_003446 [Coemansia sp. RSA 2711]|nr:hypothetical protein LPJ63_003446 [Coemansia sp. RSA 2711]KAJ2305087.1 hypothetical protein IWW54_005185 [Coemansia sp. RSA 2705]KAJ2312158.1 hypothetical protein IWW52_004924 [Coemansia sp. RSA 2704]
MNMTNCGGSFIGIHTRDDSMSVLYMSRGCQQALGFEPAQIVNRQVKDFVADAYRASDYMGIYQLKSNADGQLEEEDDASIYCWFTNLKSAAGQPILHKLISMKADNTVIFIGMAYPEAPYQTRTELEVQQIDGTGATRALNVTRKMLEMQHRQKSLFRARSQQVKAAFILENHRVLAAAHNNNPDYRVSGPLIGFCTNSVCRLIEADTSDLIGYPFLKLVAPEDLVPTTRFLEQLSDSSEIQFHKFSLLFRPCVIDGDVFVSDEENPRVIVDCMGSAVEDGVVLLVRRIRMTGAPSRRNLGAHLHARIDASADSEEDMSFFEMLSSEPDTSDANESWTWIQDAIS